MNGTRQELLGKQLQQTVGAKGRGEALDCASKEAEPLMANSAPESPALTDRLMEEKKLGNAFEGTREALASMG